MKRMVDHLHLPGRGQRRHLARVAPALVAALALPGMAQAVVERSAALPSEPTDRPCPSARIEELDGLLDLGCLRAGPPADAGMLAADAGASRTEPAQAPRSDRPTEQAASDAERCAVWASVPDLDADVALPSYCTAPVQTVRATSAPALLPAPASAAAPATQKPRARLAQRASARRTADAEPVAASEPPAVVLEPVPAASAPPTAASEPVATGPTPAWSNDAPCAPGGDVELDSAMPNHCVAMPQTILAARPDAGVARKDAGAARPDTGEPARAAGTACSVDTPDRIDSALPSYCTAPSQRVLAAPGSAAAPRVAGVEGSPGSAETAASAVADLPAGLAGAQVVGLDRLSETRGGFELSDRGQTLRISFGVERAVHLNGALVSTSTLALDGLGRLTGAGSTAQGTNVRSVASTANVVSNGAESVMMLNAPGLPAGALILQNSVNNQRLDTTTVVNAVVEASSALRASRLESAMREATAGALRR